jgi:hypothetical protein
VLIGLDVAGIPNGRVEVAGAVELLPEVFREDCYDFSARISQGICRSPSRADVAQRFSDAADRHFPGDARGPAGRSAQEDSGQLQHESGLEVLDQGSVCGRVGVAELAYDDVVEVVVGEAAQLVGLSEGLDGGE